MDIKDVKHDLEVTLLQLYWKDYHGSPRSPPPVLIEVSGIIEDFNPPYPLSKGLHLTIAAPAVKNSETSADLYLGKVDDIKAGPNQEVVHVSAKTSGSFPIGADETTLNQYTELYQSLGLTVKRCHYGRLPRWTYGLPENLGKPMKISPISTK